MAEKKTRAPGGGRKPLDPEEAQSVKVMVRITPARRKQLQDLADKHHGGNLSREIKLALGHWINRHAIPNVHNSALGTAVAVLADRIEGITGKSWIDDPLTREVARERVEQLVAHILSPLSKSVAIPDEIKGDAFIVLELLKAAMPRPGSPRLLGITIIDDRGLASILQDLARHLGEGSVNVRATPEPWPDRRLFEQKQRERKS